MANKKVQITRDDAIKGKSYKAGQVAEFPENVAQAIVYQRRGTIVADDTPITPVEEQKPAPTKKAR